MNDEKQLKEYGESDRGAPTYRPKYILLIAYFLDVNGKVVHLVQRSPPSSRPSNTPGGLNSNDNPSFRRPRMQNVIGTRTLNMSELENMMMGTFTIPVNGSNILGQQTTQPTLNPSSTLCMNRVSVARYMLRCADNIAAYLENPAVGLNNTAMDMLHSSTMESTVFEVGISAVTNSDIPQSHVNDIVSAFQGAVSAAFRQNGISNITVQQTNDNNGVQMFGSVPGHNNGPPTGSPTTASISLPINFSQMSDFNAANVANAAANAAVNAIRQTTTGDATPSSASERPRQQTTRTQTLGEVVGEMRHVQVSF